MAVLIKTMAQLLAAIRAGRVVSQWGTATIAYAIVMPADASIDSLEMWSVTP